jgi:hypothetical protein
VLWAAKAAKMDFRWQVGNGKNIIFWEDCWFGSCSLAIQYWSLYSIVNEQGKAICEVWDGENLRFTFRRTVDQEMMDQWHELLGIASSISLGDEDDTIIWQYNSSGVYSVQSLYAIVNNRGVKQVYTLMMWKIKVPPRIHIFLWLLANNKVLTRDNLAKRRDVDDKTCLFCKEYETIHHLFFECCVAQLMWEHVADITGFPTFIDFATLGNFWVLGRKYAEFNVLSSTVIWTLWKTRNNLCFQGEC